MVERPVSLALMKPSALLYKLPHRTITFSSSIKSEYINGRGNKNKKSRLV